MSEIYFADKLQAKPQWVYDDMTLHGEHISRDATEQTLVDYDETDPVQLSSILAIQALAMGSLRHAARVKLRGNSYNRRHGFAISSESETTNIAYDGATEEYMAYRIAKTGFTDWSMRIRFRSNERIPEKSQTSQMEDYYFAWRRDNEVIAASLNQYTLESDGYTTTDTYTAIRPVSNHEVIALQARMFDQVEKSGAWPEGSFLRPVDSLPEGSQRVA